MTTPHIECVILFFLVICVISFQLNDDKPLPIGEGITLLEYC
jgi:hypothetical protein